MKKGKKGKVSLAFYIDNEWMFSNLDAIDEAVESFQTMGENLI